MELEKSRVSSQVRVFKTQTRNPTPKTRLFENLYRIDIDLKALFKAYKNDLIVVEKLSW
jgi:hypothetical protein